MAPELTAATVVKQVCYQKMFRDCKSMERAPELRATDLSNANSCYNEMFFGCTNLNYVKCLATNGLGSAATLSWLQNASSTGTFVKSANAVWTRGEDGIPSNWSVEDSQN